MKRLMMIAALLSVAGTAAFAADPVEGTWQTKPDDNGHFGHVDVKPCGPAFCGVLVKAFDKDGKAIDSPNIGRQRWR